MESAVVGGPGVFRPPVPLFLLNGCTRERAVPLGFFFPLLECRRCGRLYTEKGSLSFPRSRTCYLYFIPPSFSCVELCSLILLPFFLAPPLFSPHLRTVPPRGPFTSGETPYPFPLHFTSFGLLHFFHSLPLTTHFLLPPVLSLRGFPQTNAPSPSPFQN